MSEIKMDKRNYRKHNDKNKKLINKSLKELGAGRSILIDSEDEIIGGNGVYEQAKKLGIKTKVVETDGSELVVVKRTDLKTNDEKRKKLAIMDNSTSDTSEFDMDLLQQDFDLNSLADFGLPTEFESIETLQPEQPTMTGEQTIENLIEALPPELKNTKLEPEKFEEIVSTFKTDRERIIITYPKERIGDLSKLIGIDNINKVCYQLEELLGEE